MPSLQAALNQAMSICWDESIGYNLGGMAHSSADGVDCSGLVGRCLSDAGGFNYPTYHVGTINMKPALISAGFTIIPVNSLTWLNQNIKHGDIVVMNHLDMTGGHTFFYAENITAYTDAGADSANTAVIAKAKVEASSSRGHTGNGDSKKDGIGAYWEVWCHAYYQLVSGYDPTDPNDEIYVARYDNNSSSEGAAQYLLSQFFRKRRLEDANIADWIDL